MDDGFDVSSVGESMAAGGQIASRGPGNFDWVATAQCYSVGPTKVPKNHEKVVDFTRKKMLT